MKKYLLFLLAFLPIVLFTACSSSDDKEPEIIKNSLYGKTFATHEDYGVEGLETDSTDLVKFRKCLNMVDWSIITPKPVITETYTTIAENVINGITHNIEVSFKDNQNCTITNTYITDSAQVSVTKHYYECAFNKWEQGYSFSQGKVHISATLFSCYSNYFVLGNFKYFKTINKIGDTLKSWKSTDIKKTECSYVLENTGNKIHIKDKNSENEYDGEFVGNTITIKDIFVGANKPLVQR